MELPFTLSAYQVGVVCLSLSLCVCVCVCGCVCVCVCVSHTISPHCTKASVDWPVSSHRQLLRGLSTSLQFYSMLGSHTVEYDGVWRNTSLLGDSV